VDSIELQVDLVKVMERSGIALIRQKADGYKALCPFHAEKVPSLSVTPSRGLWHCFGCGAAGTPTQFVQRFLGLSSRAKAIEKIRSWGLWPEADEDGEASRQVALTDDSVGRQHEEKNMKLKPATGNMYPWVTHTHSHLAGACPHACGYCYVQALERRFKTGRWTGPVRLDEPEFSVNYGKDRTIFVEHLNDLCAAGVPDDFISRILNHTAAYPANTYVFQTKAPERMVDWLDRLPPQWMLGTTIETTLPLLGNQAPTPDARARGMETIRQRVSDATLFVTIEPIQEELHVPTLLHWLDTIRPTFVNIGADSKGHGLQEPSAEEIRDLIAGVQELGLEIRQKTNLARLLGSEAAVRAAA
jgi:hypothetical protein